MKKQPFLVWGGYFLSILIFLFLVFLNFYPVRSRFEESIGLNTKIYDRNGVMLYETLHREQGKTTEVSLADVPKYLIQATIAAEDQNFYEHPGIDFIGITRALYLNLKEGRVVSGGSTIPQQLVRNVIGINKDRTFLQKIKESLFALRISKVFTKDEILSLYFNKIYYGNLNYGVDAASFGYFGKHVANLDLAESAFLAGLPQAPNRYDPFQHRQDALKRKDYVLSLMGKNGFISKTEMKEAKGEELHFEQNLVTVRAPHFVNYVIEELEDRLGENFVSGGLTVRTTLDYSMQEKVHRIARKNIDLLAGRNVTNASVVILEPETAEIRSMLGSVDYFDETIDGQVNIALRSRQPGSAMKPITYAATFEKGWNGATLIKDEPVRFFTADGTPYVPKNYDYEYHGVVTVREALANSYNIPAVKAVDFASVEAVLALAKKMGLTTLKESAGHYGLAITLGDGEVRLLDLTALYMIFTNGGLQKTPQAILEIRDSDGNLLYQKENQTPERVLSEDIAFMITDILADEGARIPEFGLNNILEISRPAAVKTGTTRNFRDNWTIGYTPDFVVGVWVGNSDNSAMHNISGVYGAGPIWHDIMEEIHRGKEKRKFSIPLSVEKKEFCIDENPDEILCNKKIKEWVPKKSEASHQLYSEENEKPSPLKIKKPFDRDIFQINPNTEMEVQQIKFEVEKDPSLGDITWYVNGKEAGKGDALFWQLQKGDFTIQAQAKPHEDSIHISVL